MKKLFLNFATALLCCTVMLSILTSCVNEDNPKTTPVPDPSQLADVTIMYYAHGGGTLDKHVIGNLRKMYNAERSSYNNVRIAAECKFSNEDYLPSTNDDLFKTVLEADLNKYGEEAEEKLDNITYLLWMAPEANSTFRIAIDPTKTLKEQVKDHYLPGKNCDFTTPDSLTNFINWAAKNCPAKRYILILHDHGGGCFPKDGEPHHAADRRHQFHDPGPLCGGGHPDRTGRCGDPADHMLFHVPPGGADSAGEV